MHLAAPSVTELIFWVCAVAACVMGALVVLLPNPVSSALALVVTLCAVAGLFLTLGAQFISMVQVIVYAGAIMVLFLFVIMLLQLTGTPRSGRAIFGPKILGAALGMGLLAQLGAVVTTATYPPGAGDPAFGAVNNTLEVGRALYSRYLLPFEVTSVLLLVALVGAVVLAKRKF
ncbi:MAG: NADH-quinone oxidoreductase subunit J [Candidatus Eisenbacteria bacterium]|nr:NADH-quinone oxidoreductase subunit J [Candidatus Eisenbacteria bacterium]